MKTTIGRWQLEHDSDTTRSCFARLPIGSGCECQECRNFLAALEQAFPPEFCAIADQLGIDIRKPAELAHYGREPSGFLIAGGWFHFVGSIMSGEDALRYDSQGTGRFYLEHLAPAFEVGFSSHAALVAEPFRSHPVIQLEFETRVPWLLGEEYAPIVTTYTTKT